MFLYLQAFQPCVSAHATPCMRSPLPRSLRFVIKGLPASALSRPGCVYKVEKELCRHQSRASARKWDMWRADSVRGMGACSPDEGVGIGEVSAHGDHDVTSSGDIIALGDVEPHHAPVNEIVHARFHVPLAAVIAVHDGLGIFPALKTPLPHEPVRGIVVSCRNQLFTSNVRAESRSVVSCLVLAAT